MRILVLYRAEEEAFGRSSGDDRGAGFSAAQQAITRIDTKAAHLRFRMAGIAVLNENRANSGFKKNIGILAESRDPDGRECEKQTHGELEEDLQTELNDAGFDRSSADFAKVCRSGKIRRRIAKIHVVRHVEGFGTKLSPNPFRDVGGLQ